MQEWQDFHYTSSDGLRLYGRKYGWEHTDRIPVVCLPGLTRNSADFHELALHLSGDENGRRVLALDYRGRGNSQYDKNSENYNIITEADDVVQGITAAGLKHVNTICTSRGGLIAMLLAATRPAILNSVVMNDIGPEIEGQGLVRIKAYIEQTATYEYWNYAAAFLKEAGSRNFTKWNDADWHIQARMVFVERDGKIIPNYDSALIDTLKTIDLSSKLPDMWPQFKGLSKIPLLLVRGENTDLLSSETVEKMKLLHSSMEVIEIAGQGHAPDLGSEDIPDKIAKFLDSHEASH